eukprot:COSAG04_NODE_931_length_9358_cov_2.844152_3_plen_227_part_00
MEPQPVAEPTPAPAKSSERLCYIASTTSRNHGAPLTARSPWSRPEPGRPCTSRAPSACAVHPHALIADPYFAAALAPYTGARLAASHGASSRGISPEPNDRRPSQIELSRCARQPQTHYSVVLTNDLSSIASGAVAHWPGWGGVVHSPPSWLAHSHQIPASSLISRLTPAPQQQRRGGPRLRTAEHSSRIRHGATPLLLLGHLGAGRSPQQRRRRCHAVPRRPAAA